MGGKRTGERFDLLRWFYETVVIPSCGIFSATPGEAKDLSFLLFLYNGCHVCAPGFGERHAVAQEVLNNIHLM